MKTRGPMILIAAVLAETLLFASGLGAIVGAFVVATHRHPESVSLEINTWQPQLIQMLILLALALFAGGLAVRLALKDGSIRKLSGAESERRLALATAIHSRPPAQPAPERLVALSSPEGGVARPQTPKRVRPEPPPPDHLAHVDLYGEPGDLRALIAQLELELAPAITDVSRREECVRVHLQLPPKRLDSALKHIRETAGRHHVQVD
ncbi:MAG TPA: hypothetical protein VFK80_04780 [Limnochordia bacterium]|nr:hypothetical protein [Limnochordia bacterium]